MKITKTQLQNIIREEMENLKNEGYMDAYDRSNEEEAREKRARMARIRAEDERKRKKNDFKSSFFNRDDETTDQREDHNIDDLYAMVRDLEAKVKDLKGKE
jgi:hypothetical protein